MKINQLNPASEIHVADNVTLGDNVVFGHRCKTVDIGFGAFIGRDIYIDCEHLTIGSYTTIHHGSIIHGIKCDIGHNCWFGHYTVIDSLGGSTTIGNNVGVGAHSQLWSHMKFGDVLAGCRWNSSGTLVIQDDVWLVGHSIVGPIVAEERSMLMTGSVAVKNMQANHIYAGTPATDVTDRLGGQFADISYQDQCSLFNSYLTDFENHGGDSTKFEVVESFSADKMKRGITQFDLRKREYVPLYNMNEYAFIRSMLYEKAKFLPVAL